MNWIVRITYVMALAVASPALAQNQSVPGMRSVKIEVSDFQKSIDFYSTLGMKAGTRYTQDAWELQWEKPAEGSAILMVTPAYARRAKMMRGGTYMMIMTPDVKAVADKLRGKGYPDVAEPKAMGTMTTVLMLKDPDGNRIELMSLPSAK